MAAHFLAAALCAGALLAPHASAASPTVVCRTEFQGSPTAPDAHVFGVDPQNAHVSWITTLGNGTDARGVVQTAFELQVADAHGNQVFASGKVPGDAQTYTLPATALKPGETFAWGVRVHLSTLPDQPTDFCSATIDTAPAADVFPGSSQWVGGGGQLRSPSLALPAGQVARARAYVTGVGSFYLFVNGERVGDHVMDPPQTVYSKTVLYSTFDIASLLKPGGDNSFGALLGTYKWGYDDLWCNMTIAGPDGCRALLFRADVTMADGSKHSVVSSTDWQARTGPVTWDHFFHGENYDGTIDADWTGLGGAPLTGPQAWSAAHVVKPHATAPKGMQVLAADGTPIALGDVKPNLAPPLRVIDEFPAVSIAEVAARDTGRAFVFDFGQNMAGMVRLSLPSGHGMPAGTELRIEHGEIIQGIDWGISGMCSICPHCASCGSHGGGASGPGGGGSCDSRGTGAVCDTYCNNAGLNGKLDNHTLRHEPCFPHQSYSPGFPLGAPPAHETPDRYIGDFNNANMTNVWTLSGAPGGETYTPFFAAGGFRYAQVSGFPAGYTPDASVATALRIYSDVSDSADLSLPSFAGTTKGTANVLQRSHDMTRASQSSNLWSIPTDCPQRERRGWMGDAQASCNEAMHNYDMLAFYNEFLNKILDDQSRYDANNPDDKGALADVVPYDGIGGNPGCPVWQVAYIVIPWTMWKHYGEAAIPALTRHYDGMTRLMGWFNRHADPTDHLLVRPCYGDWMGFNPESGNGGSSGLTPQGSVTAFYHVLAAQYLADIASALGKASDAQKWAAQAKAGRAAYHARYFDASAGGYTPCGGKQTCHGTSARGSQTANSMALALGAPPDAATASAVAHNLAVDVIRFGNRTTTGVVGIAWMFPMLDKYGFGDVALSVLLNDAYPSIGHMAFQNMTTLCENWACTFHAAGGGSQNHIMLGGWDAWLASSVGGLDSVVNGSTGGWRHAVARVTPAAVTRLGSSRYRKSTWLGDFVFDWKLDGGKLVSEVQVPVGAQLTVETPAALAGVGRLERIDEGDSAVWARVGGVSSRLPEGVWSVDAAMGEGHGVGDIVSQTVRTTVSSGRYRLVGSFA